MCTSVQCSHCIVPDSCKEVSIQECSFGISCRIYGEEQMGWCEVQGRSMPFQDLGILETYSGNRSFHITGVFCVL